MQCVHCIVNAYPVKSIGYTIRSYGDRDDYYSPKRGDSGLLAFLFKILFGDCLRIERIMRSY